MNNPHRDIGDSPKFSVPIHSLPLARCKFWGKKNISFNREFIYVENGATVPGSKRDCVGLGYEFL